MSEAQTQTQTQTETTASEAIPDTRPDGRPMTPADRAAAIGAREQAKAEAEASQATTEEAPAEAPSKPSKASNSKPSTKAATQTDADAGEAPRADEKRDRAELVAKLAAARKASAERDEIARQHAETKRALEELQAARTREDAEIAELLRTNPREALKRRMGVDYNDLTKALLNGGKVDPATQALREVEALKAAAEAERQARIEQERRAEEARAASATEQIYAAIDQTARAAGDAYELLTFEMQSNPGEWKQLFRRYAEANPEKTATQACEEFEAALLAREQKRASLGKIRALKDASGARPAPATTSGTKANEDGPRTLTAGMSADRPTSERRNRALTPREEKLELEERLRRAARLVR